MLLQAPMLLRRLYADIAADGFHTAGSRAAAVVGNDHVAGGGGGGDRLLCQLRRRHVAADRLQIQLLRVAGLQKDLAADIFFSSPSPGPGYLDIFPCSPI